MTVNNKMRFYSIRLPVIAVMALVLFSKFAPFDEKIPAYLNWIFYVNVLVYYFIGWYLYNRYSRSMSAIAFVGFCLFGFDQIVLTGGGFLVQGLIDMEGLDSWLEAFGGSTISFIIFSPIVVFIVVLGGVSSRSIIAGDKSS